MAADSDFDLYRQNGRRYFPPPSPTMPASSSAATLKGCCCCFFLLLTFLALLVVAVVVVILLAVKPRKPQLDLQSANVQYLLVETPPMGVSGISSVAYLSLNISLFFSASNPNRVGIKYAASTFYVMYEGVPLGLAQCPGFYQPAYSRETVETRVSVQRVNVLQTAAANLVRDASVSDRVELSVTGDVRARTPSRASRDSIVCTPPSNQPIPLSRRARSSPTMYARVSVDCVIVVSPHKQSVTYKQCGLGLNV